MNHLFQRAGTFGLLALFLFSISGSVAWSQAVNHRPDPRQLFERMRLAGLLYSFHGAMTYEHDGQLSSFQVSSGATETGWLQNISSLSGPERSFVQPLDLCRFADVGQLRSVITEETDDLALSYNFQARGEFRIAGRQAQEILVMPADGSRYGYSFAVDLETGLMLHAMTMDSNRTIMERFQLVSLDGVPQQRNLQALHQNCTSNQEREQGNTFDIPWKLAWLPGGFRQIDVSIEGEQTELVYSDGLATFSLYIEPLAEVRFPPATTSLGATSLMLNYYVVQGKTYGVTMVGELPLATLERIAAALHYGEEVVDAG